MRIIHIFLLTIAFAVPIYSEDLIALYTRSQEAWNKKDYPLFLKLTEQLVQVAPTHSGIQFQYARALAANHKNAEAIQTLQRIARMGGAPPARDDQALSVLKEKPEFQAILSQFDSNRSPSGRSTVAFRVPGKDLIPEGIAYDAVDKTFYIGSIYRRKILKVDSAGNASEFTKEKADGNWGILGMEVDPTRRHLWACTVNDGPQTVMMDPEPATEGKSALVKYDLRTGKLIKRYEVGTKQAPKLLNDVAIAKNGDVYVSESKGGAVYKLHGQTDRLELFATGEQMGYPNGIALSEDAKFVYVSHIEGITVVNTSNAERKLLTGPADSQLGSNDGLVFYANSLVGIQQLTGGVERIVRFHLENPLHVKRVEVLQVNHPLFQLPTTGDMAGDEFHYIANSQLRSFDEKGQIFPAEKLNDPVILKVDLLESEKSELRKVHEESAEAHRKTDVELLLKNSPDEFITVSSGKIDRVSKRSEKQMFEAYLKGAVYSEYVDLDPPVIHVSQDGRSGWVISRTRVKRMQNGKKQEFTYAGIMTYEKSGDRWVRVANVSTFET